MKLSELRKRVESIVRETVPTLVVDKFNDDTNLCTEYGLDSLDITSIYMNCEDEFDIDLTFEELHGAETFGNLVDIIRERVRFVVEDDM